MDKDDLFDVNKTLESPEEELKKENDKKKMKFEVYVSTGFYEQLKEYSRLKQLSIKNNYIIPEYLKAELIKHFVELSIENVKEGYSLNRKDPTSSSLDELVKNFQERKIQNTLDNRAKMQAKPQQIIKQNQIQQKTILYRAFTIPTYEKMSNFKIDQNIFLVSENKTRFMQTNRILRMFNFN